MIHARSLNNVVYWVSQIFGTVLIRYSILDAKWLPRRGRTVLGWSGWTAGSPSSIYGLTSVRSEFVVYSTILCQILFILELIPRNSVSDGRKSDSPINWISTIATSLHTLC